MNMTVVPEIASTEKPDNHSELSDCQTIKGNWILVITDHSKNSTTWRSIPCSKHRFITTTNRFSLYIIYTIKQCLCVLITFTKLRVGFRDIYFLYISFHEFCGMF